MFTYSNSKDKEIYVQQEKVAWCYMKKNAYLKEEMQEHQKAWIAEKV